MEDRNAVERTVAVRVATLVVVVGLLVGIGQGAFVDHVAAPTVVPDEVPPVASTSGPMFQVPLDYDYSAAEMARPVDTF